MIPMKLIYRTYLYITTCFFNTNITNFSNVAERLTEGIIRFVLHTNLFELHECRGEQPTLPKLESFVVEKRKHTLQHS